MEAWVEQELAGGAFPDQRVKTRLGRLLGDLWERVRGTLPMAWQDWATPSAASRFLSNDRIDEGVILAGHFAATTARFAATMGTVLVLHDTTEFSFTRNKRTVAHYLLDVARPGGYLDGRKTHRPATR